MALHQSGVQLMLFLAVATFGAVHNTIVVVACDAAGVAVNAAIAAVEFRRG